MNDNTVAAWRDHFQARGLAALPERPRSGRPVELDGEQRAKIMALACREAPAGHACRARRLLADKVVALGYGHRISPTPVGKLLKKTHSKCT